MKTKWCEPVFLLLLLLAAIELKAQNTEADRIAFEQQKAKAEQGDAAAQSDLGLMYARGHGVPQDYAEAVKWIRKAADQGNPTAESNLGVMYSDGRGVRQDYAEAVKWIRKAAEQGDAAAQSGLGTMYADGHGVPQDYAEAVKWYRKAAEQGNPQGQYNLGGMYAKGDGVSQDYAEAVKWIRKAAERGNAAAQCNLGAFYYNGQGVPQNDIEAYVWFSLSAAQGDKEASTFRDRVSSLLQRSEIAEGQRRAAAFVPREEMTNQQGSILSNFVSPINPSATGTGFFITEDGYLISNWHVVKEATQVRLVTSIGLVSANVVRIDSANDLALLKAGGHFTALPITSSRAVKLGGAVVTVGFPNIGLQGFAPKFARGEIASLSGAADDVRYFQISVPVQPGNSGSALVDERGNVVGVVSAKLNASAALAASGTLPENVNYAVKSSFLLGFLESLPEVSAKLKEPISAERKFDDVVKSAQDAAVLVLVY